MNNYIFGIADALIISAIYCLMFSAFQISTVKLALIVLFIVVVTIALVASKGIYSAKKITLKNYYSIFEGVAVSGAVFSVLIFLLGLDQLLFMMPKKLNRDRNLNLML